MSGADPKLRASADRIAADLPDAAQIALLTQTTGVTPEGVVMIKADHVAELQLDLFDLLTPDKSALTALGKETLRAVLRRDIDYNARKAEVERRVHELNNKGRLLTDKHLMHRAAQIEREIMEGANPTALTLQHERWERQVTEAVIAEMSQHIRLGHFDQDSHFEGDA